MFFRVARDRGTPDKILIDHHYHNGYHLDFDLDWSVVDGVFFKGYCLDESLREKVARKDFTEKEGHYSIISLEEGVVLHTNDSRSFPLWLAEDAFTNIDSGYPQCATYEDKILLEGGRFRKLYSPVEVEVRKELHNLDSLVDFVCQYTIDHLERINFDKPVWAADSGGVDSLLVCAAADYIGLKYKLVTWEEDEERWPEHIRRGKEYGWGSMQMYFSKEPHYQLTGFCGDEFILRNPLYCHWLLTPYQINLTDEFDEVEHSYMLGFWLDRYKEKVSASKYKFTDRRSAIKHTSAWIRNDLQMWHYNDTTIVAPFRSERLLTEGLNSEPDVILGQVIHAEVSKQAIKKLSPGLLSKIGRDKNQIDPAKC